MEPAELAPWIKYDALFKAPSSNYWTHTDVAALSLKVAAFALTLTLFPYRRTLYAWAGYELVRHVVGRLIMTCLFPLQSRIVKYFFAAFKTNALDLARAEVKKILEASEQGFQVKHIGLTKNGVTYSALAISHENNCIDCWALQATGNGEPIEYSACDFAEIYRTMKFNVLLVNGPGAGRSRGHATPATMGDAQAAGISYLEDHIKAKKIVIAGRSLGGAAISLAILKHTFKEDVAYLVSRQMTFDTASHIAAEVVGGQECSTLFKKLVSALFWWTNLEIDSVAASKKLQDLNIKEIIVQKGTSRGTDMPTSECFRHDGVITVRASLGYQLVSQRITKNKHFYCLDEHHMSNMVISAPLEHITAL